MKRKKIKKSLRNRLFVLSLSFVLVGGVCLRPFLYDVKAGEIAGTVGLLADTVTLWDIFNTMSAGAGVIVANDLLQSASQQNINDILGKPIGYLNEQGLIEYVEGTSPQEWDWSGLEEALQNSSTARNKIIRGVFGQSGGTGSGGGDNDPWYTKFMNWCKVAVQQGKIKTTQLLGNITPLTLDAISLMMGAFLGDNVARGLAVNATDADLSLLGDCQLYAYIQDSGRYTREYRYRVSDSIALFLNFESGQTGIRPKIICANGGDASGTVTYYMKDPSKPWTDWEQQSITTIQPHTALNQNFNLATGYTQSSTKLVGRYFYTDTPYETAVTWALHGGSVYPYSPDIMTQIGPAQGGSWVPTPYYNGDGVGEFEIIPQEVVTNYTTYINNNNLTNDEVGEAFEEAINPYVQTEPTPNPNPTTAPEPVATPTTAPAYDPEAELGTAANPITVAAPDPVPGIGAGEGQLPGISTLFPFCIPWDLKYILDMFSTDQSALAPHFEWDFTSTIFGNFGTIVIDLQDFDDAAAIARKLEFLIFAVSLLIGTKNLIWS